MKPIFSLGKLGSAATAVPELAAEPPVEELVVVVLSLLHAAAVMLNAAMSAAVAFQRRDRLGMLGLSRDRSDIRSSISFATV
jgi:hypothetical protein